MLETYHEMPVTSSSLSNMHIQDFAEDEYGFIWIATERGLCRYDGVVYRQYFSTSSRTSIPHNNVSGLLCDSKGRLWLTTINGVAKVNESGLFERIPFDGLSENMRCPVESKDGKIIISSGDHILEYDEDKDRFISKIQFSDGDWATYIQMDIRDRLWMYVNGKITSCNIDNYKIVSSLPGNRFHGFGILSNGVLWAYGEDGVSLWNTMSGHQLPVPPALEDFGKRYGRIIGIHQGEGSSVFIATTRNGLFVYDQLEGTLMNQNDKNYPYPSLSSAVSDIYRDRRGNIWFGTLHDGCHVNWNYKRRFDEYPELTSFFAGKSVVDVNQTDDGRLLVLTAVGDIFLCDTLENIIPLTMPQEIDSAPLIVMKDRRNSLWMADPRKLVRCVLKGDEVLFAESYPLSDVCDIFEDNEGRIWIGAQGRYVYFISQGSGSLEFIDVYRQDMFGFVSGFMQLPGGSIAAASFINGIECIDPIKCESVTMVHLEQHMSNLRFIPTCTLYSSDGTIWCGTNNNGLYGVKPDSKEVFHLDGVICNDITSLVEDSYGEIWISTMDGLSKYSISDGSIANFTVSDGIGGNGFNVGASCLWNSHSVVLGGMHGLTIFDPANIAVQEDADVYFMDLIVDNVFIVPEKDGVVEDRMEDSPEIRLPYDSETVRVSFAAVDYNESSPLRYHCLLEGYNKDWFDTRDARSVTFSHLKSGKYRLCLELRSATNGEVIATNSLEIIKLPHPLLSPVMVWLVYPLTALVVIYLILFFINRWRMVEEDRKKADRDKSFFTNIAHEFRTPLSMISGPVEMLRMDNVDDGNKKMLDIIHHNVHRMLNLVDQMLDFSRLEDDALRLSVSRGDITTALKQIVQAFSFSAAQKNINLICTGMDESYIMLFDADKLEKICANLLSNAIKFVPADGNGQIVVSFDIIPLYKARRCYPLTGRDNSGYYAEITVSDNGIGVAEEHLERIFERYFQLKEGELDMKGSGIGLYFVRKMLAVHHGYVKASRRAESKGTVFSFIIPATDEGYKSEEWSLNVPETKFHGVEQCDVEIVPKSGRKTILVVEDDVEVNTFLHHLLSSDYNVQVRFEAGIAWNDIEQINPDLIITDVVMPDMTGFELCRKIKENIATSHLPVIILSARTAIKDQVEGLKCGAESYVVKPFSPEYLLALVGSHLENREKLRSKIAGSIDVKSIEEGSLLPKDYAFLEKLYEIMEEDLGNSILDIGKITDRFHISRTKVYYKIKSLAGESPQSLFKKYKLNKACELLSSGEYNVSEVAYMTGFSTLSHFSRSFKSNFGISPTEYINKK